MNNLLPLPRWLFCLGMSAIAVAVFTRLLPLLDIGGRLWQQFPTEDGYLMLTIARNLALGHGMTTSAGTIPTNGVQPFATFVWSLGFWLTDGSKYWGVAFALLVQAFVGMATAIAMYRLGRKVLSNWAYGSSAAWLLAVLMFVSPHLIPHTMNCLETGFYLLAVTWVALVFYESDDEARLPWSWKKSIAVGLLLGWAFWVRIDAIFLIFAACVTHIFRGVPFGLDNMKQRVIRVLVFGPVSVLVALPWLVSNYVRFGSIMPVSGQSQGMHSFGQNIWAALSALLEYFLVVVPIPAFLQVQNWVAVLSGLALLVMLCLVLLAYRRANHAQRSFILMGFIVSACLFVYYGLFFGATHFVSRYMIATAPFYALMTTVVVLSLLYIKPSLGRWPAKTITGAIVLIVLVLHVRIFTKGEPHQHFQVVNWVNEYVPDSVWVGAVQTGTLGYFHDRTINLDGKVNPDALLARQQKAYCPVDATAETDCLMHYVAGHRMQYLVDWVGIHNWITIDPIDDHFDLVVVDYASNLAVLMRHGAPSLKPIPQKASETRHGSGMDSATMEHGQ